MEKIGYCWIPTIKYNSKKLHYKEAFMFFDRVSKLRRRNSNKMTSKKFVELFLKGIIVKKFHDNIFAVRVNVSLILKQL